MNLPRTAFGVMLFALFASSARADFITATVDPLNEQTQGEISGGYYVGAIGWTQNTQAAWLNQQFISFCIQTSQDINPTVKYNYSTSALSDAPVPGAGMGDKAATRISRLWAADYASLGTDPTKNAAFQVAIWKILGETIPSSITYDKSLVRSYLADSKTDGPLANLVALTNSVSQDQIVQLPSGWSVDSNGNPHMAPAPSALVLAFAGIMPLAAFRRFMRR